MDQEVFNQQAFIFAVQGLNGELPFYTGRSSSIYLSIFRRL